MKAYFDKINKNYHLSGQGDDIHLESESFILDFSLPASYEYPNVGLGHITYEKARMFPEKVLFYIFYNLPFERASYFGIVRSIERILGCHKRFY